MARGRRSTGGGGQPQCAVFSLQIAKIQIDGKLTADSLWRHAAEKKKNENEINSKKINSAARTRDPSRDAATPDSAPERNPGRVRRVQIFFTSSRTVFRRCCRLLFSPAPERRRGAEILAVGVCPIVPDSGGCRQASATFFPVRLCHHVSAMSTTAPSTRTPRPARTLQYARNTRGSTHFAKRADHCRQSSFEAQHATLVYNHKEPLQSTHILQNQ